MRRATIERGRAIRTWRRHLALFRDFGPRASELQPNRFRKAQKVAGCGKPRCWVCHTSKLMGATKPDELRAILSEREWLDEL